MFILLLAVFMLTSAAAQYNRENLTLAKENTISGYRYKNLWLFPVRANLAFQQHHKNLGNYTTLQEALLKKKIAITEVSEGNVNSLYLQNMSRDTIIVLAGEVVQGGKQDRMIAQDVLLYPMGRKTEVSVFCVEHGRWSAREGNMAFNQYYSISTKEVRKAGAVSKNQNEVWNKVAETTEKNRASSNTGTLTSLKDSRSYVATLKEYNDHFGTVFGNGNDVIGIVAVSGNEILGADLFASNALFRKQYQNLLNSYASEAITSGKPASIDYQKVLAYFNNLMDEKRQEKEVKENGTMLKKDGKTLHISTF